MVWSNDTKAGIDIGLGIIIAAINLVQATYLLCFKKKLGNNWFLLAYKEICFSKLFWCPYSSNGSKIHLGIALGLQKYIIRDTGWVCNSEL